MHARLLVLWQDTDPDATSEKVRENVLETLIDDPGFCGEGSIIHPPVCDWLLIGGRWSGDLTRARGEIPEPDLAHIEREMKSIRQMRAETGSIWSEMSQEEFEKKLAEIPEQRQRHIHRPTGYEDDAQFLDIILWENEIAPLLKKKGVRVDGHLIYQNDLLAVLDWEQEPLTEELIGQRWVVVVDYHH